MRSGRWIVAALWLAGCGGSEGGHPGSADAPVALTPATTWTVSGQLTLADGELATNLKMMASYDILDGTGASYVSPVLALAATGAPAVTSFSLSVDAAAVPMGEGFIFLYVFEDEDDDDLKDISERYETVIPLDASCEVWGNGTSWTSLAIFEHWSAGDSSMGTDGSGSWTFEAPVTGWYATNCGNDSCSYLVTTDDPDLSGANVTYQERIE